MLRRVKAKDVKRYGSTGKDFLIMANYGFGDMVVTNKFFEVHIPQPAIEKTKIELQKMKQLYELKEIFSHDEYVVDKIDFDIRVMKYNLSVDYGVSFK